VREAMLWRRVFGLGQDTVIEAVDWDGERDALVVSVRLVKNAKLTCGRCGAPAPGYDRGDGRRQWRAMEVGEVQVYLEGDAPRVSCPEHGPTVARLPWARHGARQARWFEDQVAWLAVHTSKTAVVALMRIAWRTVGSVVGRLVAEGRATSIVAGPLVQLGLDLQYPRLRLEQRRPRSVGTRRISPTAKAPSSAGSR
jgi:transposase